MKLRDKQGAKIPGWPLVKDTMWNRMGSNVAFGHSSQVDSADALYSRCALPHAVHGYGGHDDTGHHVLSCACEEAAPQLTFDIRQEIMMLASIDAADMTPPHRI